MGDVRRSLMDPEDERGSAMGTLRKWMGRLEGRLSRVSRGRVRSGDVFSDVHFNRFVIESLPIAILAMDDQLRITWFNSWAEKLTGYKRHEALGQQCWEILKSDMCGRNCPIKMVLNQVEPSIEIEGETIIRNCHGEIIPVRLKAAGLFDGERHLLGAVEVLTDISQLRTLQRERVNLISMFAHDMRSSITGIHGLGLRLLNREREKEDSKERQYLEVMTREAAKLEALVDDFLEFSRLETGHLRLNFSSISLDKEFMEVYESYAPRAAQKGIRLEIDIEDLLPVIEADGSRLRRVFANLLDNAVKYSPSGETVKVAARSTESEIVVMVIDHGKGIAREDLPYIFDSFRRGQGSEKTEGFGLGLATVKAIVDGHGGRLVVSSDLGKGSVFSVFLPITRPVVDTV